MLYPSRMKQSGGGSTSGTEVYIDGIRSSASRVDLDRLIELPDNINGAMVVYNNTIHILGGNTTDTSKRHLVIDNGVVTDLNDLPQSFTRGAVVVYNNEIHILGDTSHLTTHYKWNGSEWSSVSTLPYSFRDGSAVVYNNEIHILGGDSSASQSKHYKWNGSEWSSVSTLPYAYKCGSAVVYNNEIHILGSNGNYTIQTNHYKWDGNAWSSVSTLPYYFLYGTAVAYNNEIHIMGGSSSGTERLHYKFDGETWQRMDNLLSKHTFYTVTTGSVVFDNFIYVEGNDVYPFIEIVGKPIKTVTIA